MERLLRVASPLGLYAEEFDAPTGRHLGNFPQAFSHLALIDAAARIIVTERLAEFATGGRGRRGRRPAIRNAATIPTKASRWCPERRRRPAGSRRAPRLDVLAESAIVVNPGCIRPPPNEPPQTLPGMQESLQIGGGSMGAGSRFGDLLRFDDDGSLEVWGPTILSPVISSSRSSGSKSAAAAA